ncbi:MAG: MCE family protein, partial [Verrucomicrobiota bacterium]|nr:MCE family protein [Verrucomicrobiota bacterium]
MTDRIKNILIGLFVLGAIGIMISVILFLKPTVGDGKKILSVRFANITGIGIGTRVTFAGKPVGTVTHIRELTKARDEADEHGRIYMYQLTLKIDSNVDVYSNDEIAIKTTGLMGEKSIAILPKASTPTKPASPIIDQIVYASSTDALEHTFNQVSHAANQMETTVRRVDSMLLENQTLLTSALKSFDGAMKQIDQLLGSMDREKLVPALTESVNLLSRNMEMVKASLEEDQLLHKLASLTESLDQAANAFNNEGAQTLVHLNQIARDIASGSGTVGRLIVGDDLYLRLASLMNKGETLMNDINHYGLLFHYNKQWQKSRTRKASFLKALDTPQEF